MDEIELISNKIFKIDCNCLLDKVDCNIKNFPNNKEIKMRIYEVLRSKDSILFPKLLKIKKDILYVSTNNNQKFRNLPIEVENMIFNYLDFGFNIENLTKNVLKKKFISKLESIIDDNNFDLMWYDFGTRDYIWARDTIHSANEAISNINLL